MIFTRRARTSMSRFPRREYERVLRAIRRSLGPGYMTGKEGIGPAIGRVLDVLTIAGGLDGRGEYLAFCPAHDDRKTPNLRLPLRGWGRLRR